MLEFGSFLERRVVQPLKQFFILKEQEYSSSCPQNLNIYSELLQDMSSRDPHNLYLNISIIITLHLYQDLFSSLFPPFLRDRLAADLTRLNLFRSKTRYP